MLFSCKLCNIPNNLTARSKPPLKGEEGRASAWRRGLRYAESNQRTTPPLRLAKSRLAAVARLHGACASLSQAVRPASSPFRGARKTEISIVQKLLYTFLGKCVILSSFGAGGQTRPSVGGGYFPGFLQRECRRFSERRRFRAGLSEIGCLLFAFILRRSRAHFIITYVFTERRF